jgi:hypothetical protein
VFGFAAFLADRDGKAGRMVMKARTRTNNLGFICVSSMGLGSVRTPLSLRELLGASASGVLQHLSSRASERDIRELGRQLTALARRANLDRRSDTVESIAQILLALPLPPEFHSLADFYRAYADFERAWADRPRVDIQGSRAIFSRIAEQGIRGVRERAMLAVGASYLPTGDLSEAARSFLDAADAAREVDFVAHIQALWNLAIVRSVDGDHRGALHDLEGLHPLIRSLSSQYPTQYYDFLNSLAVELSAVGRNQEAKHIMGNLLASPAAARYPTWRETAEEIAVNEARGVCFPITFALSAPGASSTREASACTAETNSDARIADAFDAAAPACPQDTLPEGKTETVKPQFLPRRSIGWGITISKDEAQAARLRPTAIIQTALAPSPGKSLNPAEVCARRLAAPAYSRTPEQPSALHRHARRDAPDNICAAGGFPKFPLARGPPRR